MKGRWIGWLGLGVVVSAAGWLRGQGLEFGFPLIVHPDEPYTANAALRILDSGDPNPQFFTYPSFLIYANALVFHLVRIAGPADAPVELSTYYYWGRVATLAMAVITIVCVHHIGRRVGGTVAGLTAAVFVAVNFTHALSSFKITTDVPMTMWTTAVLVVLMARDPTQRATLWRYLAAGSLAGIAASTKYNAVYVVVAIAVWHFVHEGVRFSAIFDRRLIAAALASVIGFFAVTPYALLDASAFLEFTTALRDNYQSQAGQESATATSYAYYANYLVRRMGIGMLVLSGLGAVAIARREWRAAAVLLGFPVAYVAFMGAYPVRFGRQMTPVIPVLAVLAGYGVRVIVDLGTRSRDVGASDSRAPTRVGLRVWFASTLALAVVAMVAIPQARATWADIARHALPDTRVEAKRWIEAELPPGSKIAREFYTPTLNEERFDTTALGYFGLIEHDVERFDYLIASSLDYQRFFDEPERYASQHDSYRELFSRFTEVKRFESVRGKTTGPVIRVLSTR